MHRTPREDCASCVRETCLVFSVLAGQTTLQDHWSRDDMVSIPFRKDASIKLSETTCSGGPYDEEMMRR